MHSNISIEIRLFAQAAQLASTPRAIVRVESNLDAAGQVTIQQIAEQLCRDYPQLIDIVKRSRWAVETEFVTEDQTVIEGQCVALIPPVSGG